MGAPAPRRLDFPGRTIAWPRGVSPVGGKRTHPNLGGRPDAGSNSASLYTITGEAARDATGIILGGICMMMSRWKGSDRRCGIVNACCLVYCRGLSADNPKRPRRPKVLQPTQPLLPCVLAASACTMWLWWRAMSMSVHTCRRLKSYVHMSTPLTADRLHVSNGA